MLPSRAPCWFAALTFVALSALAGPAKTSEERLLVELNQLEDVEGRCRGSVVFTNLLDVTVAELAIEVAVFDEAGRVKNLWLLPVRRMPPGSVRVRQFLFQEDSCDGIGHILLNDVVNCEGDGLDPEYCLGVIEATSRDDVAFVSGAEGRE